MPDPLALLARLADVVADLANAQYPHGSNEAYDSRAIAAEARAPEQGQGIGCLVVAADKSPEVTSPAPADDVETVRQAVLQLRLAAFRYGDANCSPAHPRRVVEERAKETDECHRALFAGIDRLAARIAQQGEAVTDARHNLILQTICRLPDVLTSGDWEQWLEQHRSEWLNDDRAFGGWIAQRLGDTLSRLAQFEALAERAHRKGERGPISVLEYDLAVLRREGGA